MDVLQVVDQVVVDALSNYKEFVKDQCIKCDRCKKNCDFLEKYDINLFDFTNGEDLRFSCFLCDKCKQVCPKDLSGKDLALEFRKENNGNYLTAFLKNHYPLKNNCAKKSSSLLFLGCNYPANYPKTSEKLIEICAQKGIDFSIDCCKKPAIEQGYSPNFKGLKDLFEKKEVDELITACPNCYDTLKNIGINVIDVYSFLKRENIGKKIDKKIDIFFPCPDRYKREIFKSIKYFIDDYNDKFKEVDCCGLGGSAIKNEKELVDKKQEDIKRLNTNGIYTYCASCSGMFKSYGQKNIKNILSEILDVNEEVSDNRLKNRIKYK
ncbi:MAG: heterodisulfide reductase-related iron-sulfur binding cluster, partial [Tissierellia bacterium]|nr:heterodisulfide reductase-related iron-sulfur binding cluster [Tissierellia bacterium]